MKNRNIFKVLFLIMAVAVITMASGSKAYAKVNYTVTPKKVASEAKKNHSSFVNKYVQHYLGLNDYLEKMRKKGGGTLTIKKGTYKISNAIYVPSNVTIIFEDGVVFQKINKTGKSDLKPSGSMWQLCPHNKYSKKNSIGKYNGTKNVKFIAKGKVTFDMKNISGICIVAAHNKNIEISGITFKGMNGNHYIEINGTNKAYIHDCTFKKAKKSTSSKYYMKEAINIDLAEAKTGGLPLDWVKKDKTPCKNITIENNVFDGNTRGVGTHKYSQNSKGKNIYHSNIKINNNTFKNIYDNGVFVLNWKNAVITNNTFTNIGNTSNKGYSSGSHGISGGGVTGITIIGNSFENIARSAVYFIVQKNVGGGSGYKKVFVNITKEETEAMVNNTFKNCAKDANPNYDGYNVLYFRNNGTKSRTNGVGISATDNKVYYGIPKN